MIKEYAHKIPPPPQHSLGHPLYEGDVVHRVSPSRRGWIPACRKTGEDYVKLLFFILLFALLTPRSSKAQALPEYYMSNGSATDCKGILYDSNLGLNLNYAQNENYVFTICPGQGSTVQLWFVGDFCLENGFDFLRIFNGPDTLSPLLGQYTGNTAPPTINANSGCITLKFNSDANVTCTGWEAQWRAIIPPLQQPIAQASTPPCNTNTFTLTFDTLIRCNSLSPADIVMSGAVPTTVTNVTPIGCNNNLTTQFQVTLSQPITQSCNYVATTHVRIPDLCDSIWNFYPVASFLVNTCPFTVNMVVQSDTLCPGECTQLRANVTGCLGYNYTWNNGLPNSAGPFTICPNVTTTYTVNVQTQQGGPIVPANITVYVVSPNINSPNLTVCQSDAPFNLTGSPAGGTWSGPGITDEDLGTFDPDTSGPGAHYIRYSVGQCEDSILITVKPMDAGLDRAACPGSAPFQLTGFSPPGGTWNGTGVTVGGLYTPPNVADTVKLTYSFNGCTDTMTVYIDAPVFIPPYDTICQSADTFSIVIYPPGGRWYGPGIIDTLRGTFDPDDAGGGLHTLTYLVNGCNITYDIYVKPIDAFWNLASCPEQTFYQLPAGSPAGGWWSGIGVVDSIAGTYNPSVFLPATYTEDDLTYTHPNGCSDGITMYVVQTAIFRDTVYRCVDENRIWLRWQSVQSTPWNGTWTGPGTYFSPANGGRWYYDPAIAGPGTHTLFYTANGCVDSMTMIVYGPLQTQSISVCELEQPFVLDSLPYGVTWSGSGIVDATTGLFDPAAANNDTVWVKYDTPRGCTDSMQVFITPFVQATISGLDPLYCYIDTLIPLTLSPDSGGVLTGAGLVGTDFNPALLVGGGTTTITYTYGSGLCQSADSVKTIVLPPLQAVITANNDSLCFGNGTAMQAVAVGGNQQFYSYLWSDNLGVFQNVAVNPQQTTTYYVTVDDGCSDPKTDSITIYVFPEFSILLTTSDTTCYGNQGFATVNVNGPSNYTYLWGTSPPETQATLNAPAGVNYLLTVTDATSLCKLDTLVKIPGYGVLTALFSANPNLPCIPFEQNTVTFIDLSTGADSGRWFVNGIDSLPYILGENPVIKFETEGTYNIMLVVSNEGGCVDTAAIDICILEPLRLFVPNAFTPNGDGINQLFYGTGSGVVKYELSIYNRNNQLIFNCTDLFCGWDGSYKGQQVMNGVYTYIIDVTYNTGEEFRKSGTVTLIR